MLRPYAASAAFNSSSSSSSKKFGFNNGSLKTSFFTLRRAVLYLPIFAVISVFVPSKVVRQYVRRLGEKCIHNIYATSETALNAPAVPPFRNQRPTPPSYITLCHELLRRTVYPITGEFIVVEDPEVCMDWTSPHMGMMDILSGQIIASVMPGARYRHECDQTRTWNEVVVGFDTTTLQQAFPLVQMTPVTSIVDCYDVIELCKAALLNYEPERTQRRAFGFHHPMAWPMGANSDASSTRRRLELIDTGCQPIETIHLEDFESGSSYGWTNGRIDGNDVFTKFLGRYAKNDYFEKDFFIPEWDADEVVIEYDMYEIDSWDSHDGDSYKVYINDVELDFGSFGWGSNDRKSGRKNGIVFKSRHQQKSKHLGFNSGNENWWKDQKHKVSISIPPKHYASGNIKFKIQVHTDQDVEDESLGIDNVHVFFRKSCDLKPPCERETVVSFENFEDGADGWDHGDQLGQVEFDPNFTKFLGRLSKERDSVWKKYQGLPLDSDEVEIRYDMYEIGAWGMTKEDSYVVYVNGNKLDFGNFEMSKSEVKSGEVNGIEFYSRHQTLPKDIGFGDAKDQKHEVVISIPKEIYQKTRAIDLKFRVQLHKGPESKSMGIDNIKVSAQKHCPITHENEQVTPTKPGGIAHVIDFEQDADGKKVRRGTYVKSQWSKWGVSITCRHKSGGYSPGNKPRIFDTTEPGVTTDKGDPSLGSPNIECIPSGKRGGRQWGVGHGGSPGQRGENCAPVGNILVLQESRRREPKTNGAGGSIIFDFERPCNLEWIGLMNMKENGGDTIDIRYDDGKNETIPVDGFGENAAQWLQIRKTKVIKATINLVGSGACTGIGFSYPPPRTKSPTIAPTPEPTPLPNSPPTTHAPTPVPTRAPVTAAPSRAPIIPKPFGGCKLLDFEYASDGTRLGGKHYVKDEFYSTFGVTITAKADQHGYTPGGRARIFDSSDPGDDNGDPKLGAPNEACPSRSCVTEQLLVYEDFEDGDVSGWNNPRLETGCPSMTKFLGRYGHEDRAHQIVSKTYRNLPRNGEYLKIEFDLYEIDSWEGSRQGAREKAIVVVNDVAINLGLLDSKIVEPPRNGTQEGVEWNMYSFGGWEECYGGDTTNPMWKDLRHHVTIKVPPSVYPDGIVALEMAALQNQNIQDESAGYDNVKLTIVRDCSASCTPEKVIVSEDYENNDVRMWTNGRLENSRANNCTELTNFMGRMASRDPKPTRIISGLSSDSSHVNIEFDLYIIDTWDGYSEESYETLYVIINDVKVDLEGFGGRIPKTKFSGYVNGISWTLRKNGPPARCFTEKPGKPWWNDQKYVVLLKVPPRYYASTGTFRITLESTTDQGRTDEAYGIDNFRVVETTDCMGGPGQGDGGLPTRPGKNCNPLGNVLIVQESNKERPDGNQKGGELIFDFENPVYIDKVGLLNVEDSDNKILIETEDTVYIHHPELLGANSFQHVPINRRGVRRITYDLKGSGAVESINICEFTPPPPDTESCAQKGIILQSVTTQIIDRLTRVAFQFKDTTTVSPMEEDNGVVIWVDPVSVGVPVHLYKEFIVNSGIVPQSLIVLSNPLCMSSNLESGQPCSMYADQVVNQLKLDFPLAGKTPNGGQTWPTEFKIIGSSAGAFSRLARAKVLICPPGSPTCLLPALALPPNNKAILLESESHREPSEFFDFMGGHDKVQTIILNPSAVPAPSPGAPTPLGTFKTTNGDNAAEIFSTINLEVFGEGFADNSVNDKKVSVCEAYKTESVAVIAEAEKKLARTDRDKYVQHKEVRPEIVPPKHLMAHFAYHKNPWRRNYRIPATEKNGGRPKDVSTELGKDLNTRIKSRKVTTDAYISLVQDRKASRVRIQQENHLAKKNAGVVINPGLHMEVECPLQTPDNSPVFYLEDGSVLTYHKSSVPSNSNNLTVSDGGGTVTYAEKTLKSVPQILERDANGDPQVTITDPATKIKKTFKGKEIKYDTGNSLIKVDGAGAYSYDKITKQAVLITEARTGSTDKSQVQTVYSGTAVSTGSGRAPGGSVVRSDGGYAKLWGEKRDSEFRGFARTPDRLVDVVTEQVAFRGYKLNATDIKGRLNQKEYNFVGDYDGPLPDDVRLLRQRFVVDRKLFAKYGDDVSLICDDIRQRQANGNMKGIRAVKEGSDQVTATS